ncbi:hypothetical protein ACIRQP_02470 [Streptomyces sp. NPDC102274]|uniref:hypothetical protein n=1 Tax=Streptomyces sp. NPDC102274 TaxID=3366151 RepID=UPI00382C00DB
MSDAESSAGWDGGEAGGVVVCEAGGLVVGDASAVTGVVARGCGLVVAAGRVVTLVRRGFFVAVVATTVVAFRGGLVIAEECAPLPESRGSRMRGRTDDESVSVASVSVVAVAFGSGVADACVSWPVDGRDGSTASVRPPPTSATVDATTARRRCFFQRASWRRRAARPGVTGTVSSEPPDGPESDASAIASWEASETWEAWETPGVAGSGPGWESA